MNRFRKISQTIWHCHYHIVGVPKHRLRILEGRIAVEVENYFRAFSEQQSCEIEELDAQIDPVHLFAIIPPKISIYYVGRIKGRSAIRILNKYKKIRGETLLG
jgi:putative transposase